MSNKQLFLDVLKKENLKCTPQRLAIFENVIKSKKHRESEQIYKDINNKMNVSLATVYRTLDLLVKNDFIRKMDVGDGKFIYETKINHPHHDHMICVECGTIIEFHSQEIEDLQDKVCQQLDFKIIRHIHQLFGKCSDCN